MRKFKSKKKIINYLIFKKKFNSLSKLISTPEIIKNSKKYILLSKEYKFLDKIINYYNNLKKNKTNIKEIENLLKKDSDKELLELAFLEKKNLFLEKKNILNKIENLLKKKNYKKILDLISIRIKYQGYFKKEEENVKKMSKLENFPINFNYKKIKSLSIEAKEKLINYKPNSIGEALKISGVSPSDISILILFLRKYII
ncbi:MAG: PCRF domain-containing protein [Candidatus Karelsulcia muelleri]